MSIKRTWAISGAISFFSSAAICLHEQCANYPLTSSEEVGSEKQRACFVDGLKRGIVQRYNERGANAQSPAPNAKSEGQSSIKHRLLLRHGRGSEFFEARIVTDWIEHRIEPEY